MPVIAGEADIQQGLAALVELDPGLARVIALAGPVPLRLSQPGFAGLAQIIVSQMVSKASAAAIWGRMAAQGEVTADRFLGHAPDMLAGFGLSRAKLAALDTLARAVDGGTLDLAVLGEAKPEEAMERLVSLKGVGPWTAEVYLMFCLGARDIFPAGDVALRAAVGHALGMSARPNVVELGVLARRWSPWRSVAARLFWAYYATAMRRDALVFN